MEDARAGGARARTACRRRSPPSTSPTRPIGRSRRRCTGGWPRCDPSPVIELNRAVAVAMADGPAAGLALIDAIAGLDSYHLFHSARADLLRRLGRAAEARAA